MLRAAAIPTARPGGRGGSRSHAHAFSHSVSVAAGPGPAGVGLGLEVADVLHGLSRRNFLLYPEAPPRALGRPEQWSLQAGLSPVRPAAGGPQLLPLVPAVADELAPLPVTDRNPADPERPDIHGARWPLVVERERLTGRVHAKRERPSARQNAIRPHIAAGRQRPAPQQHGGPCRSCSVASIVSSCCS